MRDRHIAVARRVCAHNALDQERAERRRLSLATGAVALLAALAAIPAVYGTEPGALPNLVALLVGPLLAGVSGAIFCNVIVDGRDRVRTAHPRSWRGHGLYAFLNWGANPSKSNLTVGDSDVMVLRMAGKAPRVVVVSGHMVDTPARTSIRFPPDQVPRVTEELRRTFDRWAVGPGTTVITGGARGTPHHRG